MKIVIGLLLVITGNSMQAKGFATSIFWQAPPNAPTAQFMFSDKDPGDMSKIYSTSTFKGSSEDEGGGGTSKQIITALYDKVFNQYIGGSYFTAGTNSQTFYFTGPTKEGPSHFNTTMSDVRLACLGMKQVSVKAIYGFDTFKKIYLHSGILNYLITLARLMHNKKNSGLLLKLSQMLGDSFILFNMGETINNFAAASKIYNSALNSTIRSKNGLKIWNKNNVYGWRPTLIAQILMQVVAMVFDSSLITQKTTLTPQRFTPVGSVLATTYFDDDNIVVAYHAITPGKGTVKVSNSTTLADIMANQNTYTNMYPKTGTPACGDTFGF